MWMITPYVWGEEILQLTFTRWNQRTQPFSDTAMYIIVTVEIAGCDTAATHIIVCL